MSFPSLVISRLFHRSECEEDPSCTQLLLKWEIPRESQTFDITSWDPSGAGISANPGCHCLQEECVCKPSMKPIIDSWQENWEN